MHSKQDIENAAKVAGGRLKYVNEAGAMVHFVGSAPRFWQPWADTEAGSADWAVLDTAVWKWFADDAAGDNLMADSDKLIRVYNRMKLAAVSGDFAQRKTATMAAAVAIGKHLRESA